MEENPLTGLFQELIAARRAEQISVGVARVQKAHYDALLDEGMDEDSAVQLTADTSKAVLEAVASGLGALAQNAKPMGEAFVSIADYFTIGNGRDRS